MGIAWAHLYHLPGVQWEGRGAFRGEAPAWAQAAAHRWVLAQVCEPGAGSARTLQGSGGEEAAGSELKLDRESRSMRFLPCHQAVVRYSPPYIC